MYRCVKSGRLIFRSYFSSFCCSLSPLFSPTQAILPAVNPDLPAFDPASDAFALASLAITAGGDISKATLPPTPAPTLPPADVAIKIIREETNVTAVRAAMAFDFDTAATDVQALSGSVALIASLAVGMAEALGMPHSRVTVTTIGGLSVGTHHRRRQRQWHRRRQLQAVDVEFEIASLEVGAVAAAALERNVRDAALSGAVVANVQVAAAGRGVLTAELKAMVRSVTAVATSVATVAMMTVAETVITKHVSVTDTGGMRSVSPMYLRLVKTKSGDWQLQMEVGPGVLAPANPECTVAGDCSSGICISGKCGAASCTDGVKNGAETDVDCGGSCATKCDTTGTCSVASDCKAAACMYINSDLGTCSALDHGESTLPGWWYVKCEWYCPTLFQFLFCYIVL